MRSSEVVALHEHVEHALDQLPFGMPAPWVVHCEGRPGRRRPSSQDIHLAAPVGLNFTALGKAGCLDHLREPHEVAFDLQTGSGGSVPHASDCLRCTAIAFAACTQTETTVRRSSRIGMQNGIFFPCVMRETSSRSSTRRLRCITWRAMTSRARAMVAWIGRLHPQGLCGSADRRQRIAQFVRKHGEEGVLAAVLVLERGQPLARHPLAVPQAAHEFRNALRGFRMAA